MLKQKSLPELFDKVVQEKEISIVSTLNQAALMLRWGILECWDSSA